MLIVASLDFVSAFQASGHGDASSSFATNTAAACSMRQLHGSEGVNEKMCWNGRRKKRSRSKTELAERIQPDDCDDSSSIPSIHTATTTTKSTKSNIQIPHSARKSRNKGDRRIFFASTLLTAGMSLYSSSPKVIAHAAAADDNYNIVSTNSNLKYKTSPVNKRSGITVFDVEEKGYYNVQFVTFLSRFLINFDADCQRWWTNATATAMTNRRRHRRQKHDSGKSISGDDDDDEYYMSLFGAFSASVEVGLQEYEGRDGPRRLLNLLVQRYCNTATTTNNEGHALLQEARRQLALLFGLLDNGYQPVDEISKLLAAVDNASIERVVLMKNNFYSYAEGDAPPRVSFPDPNAGEGFARASGRAIMGATGRLLRVDLVDSGSGYKRAPSVVIAPPASGLGRAATARAILTRDTYDVEKRNGSGMAGRSIERIVLLDGGETYSADEAIKVTISAPDGGSTGKATSAQATGKAVREYKVVSVDIVSGGSGYATNTAIPVYIEPPSTKQVAIAGDDGYVPMEAQSTYDLATAPSPDSITMNQAVTSVNDIDVTEQPVFLSSAKGKATSRNCIGLTCSDDERVILSAFARAEHDPDIDFWRKLPDFVENDVELERYVTSLNQFICGTTTAFDFKENHSLWNATLPSQQLLRLTPSGYGLQLNNERKRYEWAFAPNFSDLYSDDWWMRSEPHSNRIDSDFGPRGRFPIEKLKDYDLTTALRFTAAGALCSSGAHLILTPIDVVKTKMQVDSSKYTNIFSSFQKVMEEGNGVGAFFTGWAPTFAGYFVWGGTIYTVVELVRRYLTDYLGQTFADVATLEVPIVIFASSLSAVFGALVICPFEAVRIRTVSRPEFGTNIVDVFDRMVKDEGFQTLFAAVPAFLLKDIPFAVAKFTVFDVVSNKLYESFPNTRDDIKLSLYVTLLSGIIGGMFASVVSNPADSTISAMKKAKSDSGPVETAKQIWHDAGVKGFFTGLQLRLLFNSLIVSIQFLLYDSVKLLFRIGSDDLKLYLDVLGGALNASG